MSTKLRAHQCAVILWGLINTDPRLITTPTPPWSGTGMNEKEFLTELENKKTKYFITGSITVAAGILFYAWMTIQNSRNKRSEPVDADNQITRP